MIWLATVFSEFIGPFNVLHQPLPLSIVAWPAAGHHGRPGVSAASHHDLGSSYFCGETSYTHRMVQEEHPRSLLERLRPLVDVERDLMTAVAGTRAVP